MRAVPPWAEPVGSDAGEQGAEAAREALDARARPREAAAERDAALQLGVAAEAEPDAEPAVAAAELDAGLQPGAAAEAALDAVRRRGAARRVAPERRLAAGPSAFHRGRSLPWLAP